MKEHFEKANIEIKLSPIHRYGVFAAENIAPKKIIEECPVLVFGSLKQEYRATINNRAFSWDIDNDAIILGWGSVYNHAEQPNAEFIIDHQNQIMSFIATKHIPAGTEILINYGKDWFSSRNLKPLATKPQKDHALPFRIIGFLLLLLILSKIFPSGLYRVSTDIKNEGQTASSQI